MSETLMPKFRPAKPPYPGLSWIVCWTNVDCEDDYVVDETYELAKAAYDSILTHPSTFSVTLCAVIESSEYDPHPTFKKEIDHE